jgi:uncharacterized membrane protein YfcA
MEFVPQLPIWVWCAIVAVAILAAIAHGAIGFGFPLLSTPMIAMFTDVRTAVLTTLLPNIVINIISVVRGTNWAQTLRQYWLVALYVFLGTLLGTHVLAFADVRVLKLLLAGMIIVYLLQSQIGALRAMRLEKHPRVAQVVYGFLGGFFSGTVNVAVPPLLIYFSGLAIAPIVMTQAMNLCFLTGRATQTAALLLSGRLGGTIALLSIPLSAIAVSFLFVGFRVQRRIDPQTFIRILRYVLWAMAAVLLFQALAAYFN